MIFSIALGILCVLGGLVALMLGKAIIWLLRSFKYMKQGIPTKYFPFIGYAKYLDNPQKDHGLEDFFQLFKDPKNPNKTQKILQMNGFTADPTIFVIDKELVKEFFQKETQVSYTTNAINFPAKEVLVFSNDAHGVQKQRAIFTEIFFPTNMEKHTPHIRAIVQRHLNRIKNVIKESGSENQGSKQAEIELKPYISDIFSDMVSFVLFGGEIPEVDGVMLVNQIDKVINGCYKNLTSFPHIATLGLWTKLGLDPDYNQIMKLYRQIIKKLKEVVKERENSKTHQFGSNFVDLLILKNRELEAQGKIDEIMSYDQIADTIFALIFAGTDTTRNVTESSLYKLSTDPQLQKDMREVVRKEVFDTGNGEQYKKYVESKMLKIFMKEALRVFMPASMSFHRKITKTFTLGPYTISKGDFLIVPFTALHLKPEIFDKARTFDLAKYEEEKKIKEFSRSVLIPFSVGKRSCPGRNLAEIMFKIIFSNFVDQFELEKSSEPNRRFLEFSVGIKHCKARLRCLK